MQETCPRMQLPRRTTKSTSNNEASHHLTLPYRLSEFRGDRPAGSVLHELSLGRFRRLVQASAWGDH